MTISFMRVVDRFAGIPLCWAAGLARAVLPKRKPPSLETILVIKFFGLGSILLASPALREIRRSSPNVTIIFLTFAQNAELLNELHLVDELWTIDPKSVFTFVATTFRTLSNITRTTIDAVLDLEFFAKLSTLLGAFANPAMHIGFALPTRWRTWNVTHAIPIRNDQHIAKTFLDALSPLGYSPTSATPPRIVVHESSVSNITLRFGLKETDEIICVNPNAGLTSVERRWSPANFSASIDALLFDHPHSRICLIGSKEDRTYTAAVLSAVRHKTDRTLNLAGMLSIRELAALFSISRVLLTNDTGPMHIAAAVDLPTVALFGPESPAVYAPLGGRSVNLYAALGCSPCLNIYNAKVYRCPYAAQCMKEISIGQVSAAVSALLTECTDVLKEVA